jgi:hypothetical protein
VQRLKVTYFVEFMIREIEAVPEPKELRLVRGPAYQERRGRREDSSLPARVRWRWAGAAHLPPKSGAHHSGESKRDRDGVYEVRRG